MHERADGQELIVRTHHIGLLGKSFVPRFLEFSHGVKPWEYPLEKFSGISDFIRNYVEDSIGTDKMMRNFYAQSVDENPEEMDDYLYACDLIGFDNSVYNMVLSGRIDYFRSVIKASMRGKNFTILLTDDPDGYCKSCAIGEHCTETLTENENRNFIYKKAMMELMENNVGRGLVKREMLGTNENGQLFITAELLFNPMFHNIVGDLFARIET
jgi:hypothetical protein